MTPRMKKLLDLQAIQEKAWKNYVDTVLVTRQAVKAAGQKFNEAEKAFEKVFKEISP